MTGLPRRRFLELTLTAISAGAAFATVACGSDASTNALDAAKFFPQSLASGDPRPTSVVLWTRLVDKERPNADLELRLEVATDEAFSQRLSLDGKASRALTALAAFDHCVK